jgi:hypothetical protein
MLKPKQLKLIEAIISAPDASNVKLAEMVGVNRNTITEWKRNEEWRSAFQARLREIWRDSEIIAIDTMRNLAVNGDFKASKYILDSLGYAPTQKIEADLHTDIQINIEE